MVKDNCEKIKAGESDEEFLRRGLAKIPRIEKKSRIAKKNKTKKHYRGVYDTAQ